MLIDWLWAFGITLFLALEISGWSWVVERLLLRRFTRSHLASELKLVTGLAVAAQAYFALSLTGFGHYSSLHLALGGLGATLLMVSRALKKKSSKGPAATSEKPHWHLARLVSPMSWKRGFPWLAVPVIWTLLWLTETLVPHNQTEPLAVHLFAPHRWIEEGTQRIDPLNPLAAQSMVWEGLYYHVLALLNTFGPVHRTVLVRTQIVSQLIHFVFGQLLCIYLLSKLISPFVRSGWYALVHTPDSGPTRRHQLGMAATVATFSSLFFAWMACAPLGLGSNLAANDWGAAVFVFAAIAAMLSARPGLGWFLGATALATNFSTLLVIPGLLGVTAFSWLSHRPDFRRSSLHIALGVGLGLAAVVARNFTQTGRAFYPFLEGIGASPGWIATRPRIDHFEPRFGLLVMLILVAGIPSILLYFSRLRFRLEDRAMAALLVFVVVNLCLSLSPAGLTLPLTIVVVLLAALGIEYLFTILRGPELANLGRWIPYLWLAVALFSAPIPFHFIWQNLPLAFVRADQYLAQNDAHFTAKLWANTQLPQGSQILWTADREFYYLEHKSASLKEAHWLKETLAHARTPSERASILCDLGFTVLAWEDRHHGPEVAGLYSWLRLSKSSILHTSDEVTLFALECGSKVGS